MSITRHFNILLCFIIVLLSRVTMALKGWATNKGSMCTLRHYPAEVSESSDFLRFGVSTLNFDSPSLGVEQNSNSRPRLRIGSSNKKFIMRATRLAFRNYPGRAFSDFVDSLRLVHLGIPDI